LLKTQTHFVGISIVALLGVHPDQFKHQHHCFLLIV